jgi:CelD/BcsL family acetyltransferase involved in cellulose biosynthesis
VDLDKLRAAGTDYLGALSGNTRSQIRRSLRRYEADFGERYVHHPETRDRALAAFDAMVELHDLRWASLGTPSGFTEASRTFHRELISELWSDGERSNELEVDILEVGFGDHVIGVIYSLICRRHVQFFQSGLVYTEDPRLKPGLACHALAIEHYMELGASEYDFLGGEAKSVQYKTSLSTDLRHLDWGHLELGTRRIKALGVARAMKRRLSLFAE